MKADSAGFGDIAQAICNAIAQDISGAETPDWAAAERSASDDRERKIVHNLRAVAKIAAVTKQAAATAPRSPVVPPPLISREEDSVPESWGHLKILGRIGKGSFGSVYRAWDSQLERQVALKLLRTRIEQNAGISSAVLKEGRLLARVTHDNVARVHGADVIGGQLGVWMELVEGPTLEDLVRERGSLTEAEAVEIGLQVCSALQAIHDAGVVHQDVKAQNVILDTRASKPRAVLTDFGGGVTRNLASRPDRDPRVATPLYMAPQLFEGGEPSPRTDVYSVGVLLFFLATGKYPVDGRTAAELRAAHARGDRTSLRELSASLSDHFVETVERACASDPAKRFESARRLELELSEAPRPTKRWMRAAAAGIVAAGILGLILMRTLSAPFTAEATLVRAQPGGHWEPLTNHSWTKPGDRIALEFEASARVHLYIFNFDEMGRTYLLFPLPDGDLKNPLPANSRLRLPGPQQGEEMTWIVDSIGGRERFHVLASRERLGPMETIIARLPAADSAREIPPEEVRELFRGVGRVAKLDEAMLPEGSSAEELFDVLRQNSEAAKKTRKFWVTEIVLENPARPE
jgi:hypothetical protein